MAELLTPGWWPVDKLIVGYLAAVGLLMVPYAGAVPHGWVLVAAHATAIALVALATGARPNRAVDLFRHWYPLFYVASCYKEMALLIPVIRGTDLDATMARIDQAIWHTNPTVWLERLQTPAVTEFLQIAYSFFIPAVLLPAFLFWFKGRRDEFRYYAFLVSLGFLASYIGYLAVPVRGPRFFLAQLHQSPLQGLWLFNALQHGLDTLESAHYDCFPSGHTELTMIAWWGGRRISKELFTGYSVYTVCIVLATVYLRYHDTIDVFAGAVLAVMLLWAAPHLYRVMRGLVERH